MRIRVGLRSTNKQSTEFHIEPARTKDHHTGFYPEDMERLHSILYRIERMAQRQLGDCYQSLEATEDGLTLCVKVGTFKGERRLLLRALQGWIELFDDEVA